MSILEKRLIVVLSFFVLLFVVYGAKAREITIEWDANVEQIHSYRIYRSERNISTLEFEPWVVVQIDWIDTIFTDVSTDLLDGLCYSYLVTALDPSGAIESGSSNPALTPECNACPESPDSVCPTPTDPPMGVRLLPQVQQ